MKFNTLFRLTFAGLMLFAPLWADSSFVSPEDTRMVATPWQYLVYPMTTEDGWKTGTPLFTLAPNNGEQGLYLQIDGLSPDFFKTHRISASLHRANGDVVNPVQKDRQSLNSPFGFSTASRADGTVEWSVSTVFPWGPNTLEESWIEVSDGVEHYWLEIPYGFDRNPVERISSPAAGGPPKLTRDMKVLTARDHLIPWTEIQYDLGEIQNGWRLSLHQSNGGEPQSEVILYPGKPWDPGTRRTSVAVSEADGSGVYSGNHIQESGGGKGEVFSFSAHDGKDVRRFGIIKITVGTQTYPCVVPSSLYETGHGHIAF